LALQFTAATGGGDPLRRTISLTVDDGSNMADEDRESRDDIMHDVCKIVAPEVNGSFIAIEMVVVASSNKYNQWPAVSTT
jgi:hypothetical protein